MLDKIWLLDNLSMKGLKYAHQYKWEGNETWQQTTGKQNCTSQHAWGYESQK